MEVVGEIEILEETDLREIEREKERERWKEIDT